DQKINDLKSKLADKDKEVGAYKERAVNELPQALDSNIKMAESLQGQYDTITSKIADEQSRRTIAAKNIADLEAHGVQNQPMVTEMTPEQAELDKLHIQEKEL